MLWTIIILLIILWVLGMISHVIGSLINILLIAAVIIFAIKLLRKIF